MRNPVRRLPVPPLKRNSTLCPRILFAVQEDNLNPPSLSDSPAPNQHIFTSIRRGSRRSSPRAAASVLDLVQTDKSVALALLHQASCESALKTEC